MREWLCIDKCIDKYNKKVKNVKITIFFYYIDKYQ